MPFPFAFARLNALQTAVRHSHTEVASWTTKTKNSIDSNSTLIFDENIGEDGLSSQSTYDVSIKSLCDIPLIGPTRKLLQAPVTDEVELRGAYATLIRSVNELRAHHSTNHTLFALDKNGQAKNMNIAEAMAHDCIVGPDDPEFCQWSADNKLARFWYCKDLSQSPILKLAIEKAINNTLLEIRDRNLFVDEKDGINNQFVGFVSSHRTGNIVNCFHIHSFAVFFAEKNKHDKINNTIVTCLMTSRNHIMSNMQDRVLQLMQLIQFCANAGWSVTVTNNFIGNDVQMNETSLAGFESMGFDVATYTQDSMQDVFSFTTEQAIPLADCSY